jgi:aminotransferase
MGSTPMSGSAIRYNLMELAAEMQDVISLGRGDPDLPTPGHIIAVAKDVAGDGRVGLAPVEGLPLLRSAIAHKLESENGLAVGPENVLVTTGVQEALFMLLQATLNPGDEILVPDPRYTSYDQAIQMAGGTMVPVPTVESNAFDLDVREFAVRVGPRTKAILIVTPSNPTAGVVTERNLRQIAELAQERNLIVISDEIYEKYIYDGWRHLSIGSLPGMLGRTVTLNGFSKTYSMTGWRVGYVAGPVELIANLARFKGSINLAAPTVSQWAARAALVGPQDCVEEYRRIYLERRDLVKRALDEIGISYGDPRGAFYVFANIRSTGLNAWDFAYQLLQEARVLIFPGTGFGEGWDDYVRISLLQPKEKLLIALERMVAVIQRWPAEH